MAVAPFVGLLARASLSVVVSLGDEGQRRRQPAAARRRIAIGAMQGPSLPIPGRASADVAANACWVDVDGLVGHGPHYRVVCIVGDIAFPVLLPAKAPNVVVIVAPRRGDSGDILARGNRGQRCGLRLNLLVRSV